MCRERTLFPTSTQAKWERKIQVKSNPFFLRESDHLFFFHPWKALAKRIKNREKKKVCHKPSFRQNIKNICVFAFKLLLETK